MKPRERRETGETDLFRSRLDQINNWPPSLEKMCERFWTCVDALVGARRFFRISGAASGADMCPASISGRSDAAGPYGSSRTGSISLPRARSALSRTGFPDPVFPTICAIPPF